MKNAPVVLLFALPLFSQQTMRIEVVHGRPVAELLDRYEGLSGIPIHYEDPRYEYPGDIEDVSAKVRNPAHQGPPTRRVLVPKSRSLSTTFLVESDGRLGNPASLENALTALVSASHAHETPGTFRIGRYGQALFLLPTDVRDVDGSAKPYLSVLETPITVKISDADGLEALDTILKAISKASGQRLVIGTIPFLAFASARFSTDSQQRPAADVIADFFSKLSGNLAIRMFYGPDVKYYAFNVHPVVNPAKGADPIRNQDPPAVTKSPWGKTAQQ